LLKILFVALLAFYLVRRFIINLDKKTDQLFDKSNSKNKEANFETNRSKVKVPAKDTMVECPSCHTFNPSQTAYKKSGKFFCNEICFRNFKN
jgi:hypothetical protein